jgi:hypothetical protein
MAKAAGELRPQLALGCDENVGATVLGGYSGRHEPEIAVRVPVALEVLVPAELLERKRDAVQRSGSFPTV